MKRTKRAFLFSIISLILCIAMMSSTSYAWFTDMQTVSGNKIKAGTLDIDLLMDSMVNGQYSGTYTSIANTSNAVFSYDKWEPGFSDAKKFKVVNRGDLALKYNFDFVITESYTGIENETLSNGTDTDMYRHLVEKNANAHLEDVLRVIVSGTDVGTLADVMSGTNLLMQGKDSYLLPNSSTDFGEIKVLMPTSAGNEYQNASIVFDIRLYATQYAYEEDGFGSKQYDVVAEIPTGSLASSDAITQLVDSDKQLKTSGKVEGATVAQDAINGVFNTMKDTSADVVSNELVLRVDLVDNGTIEDVANNTVTVNLDISMSATMTVTKNDNTVSTKNASIKSLDDYSIIEYNLGINKSNVSVLHKGKTMTDLTSINDTPGTNGGFIYDSSTGILKLKVKSFSPFTISYDYAYVQPQNNNVSNIDVPNDISVTSGTDVTYMSLIEFRNDVNSGTDYSNKTVNLLRDVDLTGTDWTPIGSSQHPFNGTFIGNDFTIKNIPAISNISGTDHSGSTEIQASGLFGYTNNAVIYSLTLDNIHNDGVKGSRESAGILVGYAWNGIILNHITINDNCSSKGAKYAGGLIAYCDITKEYSSSNKIDCQYLINSCSVYATIEGERVAGLIGAMAGSDYTTYATSNGYAVFSNCSFDGIVTATVGSSRYTGGFVGQKMNGNAENWTISLYNCSATTTDISGGVAPSAFIASSNSAYLLYDCVIDGAALTSPAQLKSQGRGYISINGDIYVQNGVSTGNASPVTYDSNNSCQLNSKKIADGAIANTWCKVTNAYADLLGNIVMQADGYIYKGNKPTNIDQTSKVQQKQYIAGYDYTNNCYIYNFDMFRIVSNETVESDGWLDTFVLGEGEYFQNPTDYVDLDIYIITPRLTASSNTIYSVSLR